MKVQGIDPYVKLECAGTKSVSSRVMYSNRNPKWNQQLSLNIQVPVQRGISPVIKVHVYDKDLLGGDDLVATLPFSLRDVVSEVQRGERQGTRLHGRSRAPRLHGEPLFVCRQRQHCASTHAPSSPSRPPTVEGSAASCCLVV